MTFTGLDEALWCTGAVSLRGAWIEAPDVVWDTRPRLWVAARPEGALDVITGRAEVTIAPLTLVTQGPLISCAHVSKALVPLCDAHTRQLARLAGLTRGELTHATLLLARVTGSIAAA